MAGSTPSKSVIAEQVVKFTVEGIQSARTRVVQAVQAITAQAGRLQERFRTVGQGVALFGGMASRWMQSLTRTALQGTREADQLALSWEYLGRVVGREFAPWVRLLTSGVVSLADRFRGLDAATRAGVAKFALLAAGAAAFVALLPVMAAGLSVLGAAWAVLTSPVTLTLALIAGVVIAGKKLFDFFTRGSATAAENMQEANKGWADHLFAVIEWVGTRFAQFINWLDKNWTRATSGMAMAWAKAFEDKGTLQALRDERARLEADWAKGKGLAFDVEGFRGSVRRVRGALAELPNLSEILGLVQTGIGQAQMQVKLQVGFESLQGTFDRLQQEMAGGAAQEAELKRIREQGAQLNQLVNRIAEGVGKLGREFGVVGP